MATACPDCARAKVNPLTVRFHANCMDCRARSLAHSPQFFECVAAEAVTPSYRSVLQQIAGSDWKDLHTKVRDWATKIEQARRAASCSK